MKERENKTPQVARSLQRTGAIQINGFIDNRNLFVAQRKLYKVIQGAFINVGNDAAQYPHLHTEGQYIGYTYIRDNHVQLRSNHGVIHPNWFQNVGINLNLSYLHGLTNNQRAHHNHILNWIANNERAVWARRRR